MRQTRPAVELGSATATSWPFCVVMRWVGPGGKGPTGGAEAWAAEASAAAATRVQRAVRAVVTGEPPACRGVAFTLASLYGPARDQRRERPARGDRLTDAARRREDRRPAQSADAAVHRAVAVPVRGD